MNNPFFYEPDALCIKAFEELKAHIVNDEPPELRAELDKGKMLGVLVVEDGDGCLKNLFAFSGQVSGGFKTDYFVPAVFDYLDENGYFKTHERMISNINAEIFALENDCNYLDDKDLLITEKTFNEQALASYREFMKSEKQRRAIRRAAEDFTKEEDEILITESQFQKAEYKRMCRAAEAKLAEIKARITQHDARLESLKRQRKQDSEDLQNWLFSNFVFSDYLGEKKNLLDIFRDYNGKLPPSGSGECCAPKLLQYAYNHNLKPISIAEFWWGESPKQEIRHHLHHYPACDSKCKPILDFMLRGLNYPPNPFSITNETIDNQPLEYVYVDDYIIVINKPAGMLSVHGKSDRPAAEDIVRQKFGESYFCHRLDMDTSGLLMFARNKVVFNELRRQFEEREIHKTYVAIVCGVVTQKKGTISLPLMPDPNDHPRQIVDFQNGKEAVTDYEVISIHGNETKLRLFPHTGRTHQLRVHCAHYKGLNSPIKGDRLYGHSPAPRLYLHAESITFTHPVSGERMTLKVECDF